jgi:telomerase reverse transcriptase
MGRASAPIYFAKVDVQSCFDTIPQERVVKLMERLASEDEYRISRHAEVRPPEGFERASSRAPLRQGQAPAPAPASASVSAQPARPRAKPRRRFRSEARAAADFAPFAERVERACAGAGADAAGGSKAHSVFVDNVVQRPYARDALLDLLDEHVGRNLVRLGKKVYRQTAGIPQGSVLSSLLCSFFYGDFERARLARVLSLAGASLLLRLIDDFLLVTLERAEAERFMRVMHRGDADYGISVKKAKSLVNFALHIDGESEPVPMLGDGQKEEEEKEDWFPYCGTLINTKTLALSKDRSRRQGTGEWVLLLFLFILFLKKNSSTHTTTVSRSTGLTILSGVCVLSHYALSSCR